MKNQVHCCIIRHFTHCQSSRCAIRKRTAWYLLKLKTNHQVLPALCQSEYLPHTKLHLAVWGLFLAHFAQCSRYHNKLSPFYYISLVCQVNNSFGVLVESPILFPFLSLSSSLLLPALFPLSSMFAFFSSPLWNHFHLNSYSACNKTQLAHTDTHIQLTLTFICRTPISLQCLFLLFSFAATLIK